MRYLPPPRNPELEDRLVRENIGLVKSIARTYKLSGMDFADLVSAGMMGLLHAARTYDPRKARFSTHAHWIARSYINEAYRSDNRTIRLPSNISDASPKISRFIESFREKFNRNPTAKEIQKATKLTLSTITGFITHPTAFSFDKPLPDEDRTLLDILPSKDFDPSKIPEKEIVRREVSAAVAALPIKARTAVRRFFGIGRSPVITEKFFRTNKAKIHYWSSAKRGVYKLRQNSRLKYITG